MSSASSSDVETESDGWDSEVEWDGPGGPGEDDALPTDDLQAEKPPPPPKPHKTVYKKFGHSMANVGVAGLGQTGTEADLGAAKMEWTVSVTVLGCRQLAGQDIDPSVQVTVGGVSQTTKKKKSTNDPNFDENFEFEFYLPPAVFLDKLFVLDVFHTSRFLRRQVPIGEFKMDLRTIYLQKNHMFFQRFALLLDPADPLAGPKGYVKVDVSVCKKGEAIKTPTTMDTGYEDIESQILLPADMASSVAEQQPARFRLQIHSAEGLPSVRPSLVSHLKKALTGPLPPGQIDPYVYATFAGQEGKTAVVKASSSPQWDQEIVFTEMFPPLVRTMRIHIRDASPEQPVIATTFLHLNQCSDNSTDGFMPTFGPAYVNLYGAYRDDVTLTPLNFGMGEGVAYRGRLKISLKVELEESLSKAGLRHVAVKAIPPLAPAAAGLRKEFLLFAAVMELNMINKRFAGKNLSLEMSVGNDGSGLDGFRAPLVEEEVLTKDAEGREVLVNQESPRWHSRTPATQPVLRSKEEPYCEMPLGSRKPCLFVLSDWEDQRDRMWQANQLRKAQEAWELGLSDTLRMLEMEQVEVAEGKLCKAIDVLLNRLNQFVSLGLHDEDSTHDTQLDRERRQMRRRQITDVCQTIARLKNDKEDILPKLQDAYDIAERMRQLALEPQQSIPDIFLWLVSGTKRIAFQRFRADELLAGETAEERGERAERVSTFFLKVPGQSEVETEDWEIWGHVSAYFWLGLASERRNFLHGLPRHFSQSLALEGRPAVRPKAVSSPAYRPPTLLSYKESGAFELRCHVFQARAVMPADDSGLSDPFLRILFVGQAAQTAVVEETVNPVWDECLVLPVVRLYGPPAAVAANPPRVILQIYDHDSVGDNEFLGQADGWPLVKLAQELYEEPKFPPKLSWIPVYNGRQRAGEVLVAFELFQLDKAMRGYPTLPQPELTEDGRNRFRVPLGIRPRLVPYELSALWWGVRDLRGVGGGKVERARVEVEVGGTVLQSPLLTNYAKGNRNFAQQHGSVQVMLPDEPLYRPPVTIRCLETKHFGRSNLLGTHVIPVIDKFLAPILQRDYDDLESQHLILRPKQKKIETPLVIDEEDGEAEAANVPGGQRNWALQIDDDDSFDNDLGSDYDDFRASNQDFFRNLNGKDPTVDAVSYRSGSHLELDVRSQMSSASKWTKSGKAKWTKGKRGGKGMERIVEEGGESSDEEDYGSSRPLPKAGPVELSLEERRRRAHLREAEKSLDWWSKFHVSLADMEAARRAAAPKGVFKAKRRRRKTPLRKRISAAFRSGLGALALLREKGRRLRLKGQDEAPEAKPTAQPTDAAAPALFDTAEIQRITVYEEELENEFGAFSDLIAPFRLYRGKKTFSKFDERNRYSGTFKGNLLLCPVPVPQRFRDHGFFTHLPSSEPMKVVVRVYVIRGVKLRPMDASGKADPYVVLTLGKKRIRDKENRVIAQLNPTYGRCYEMEAEIPLVRELCVQVWDWDRMSGDDLIGETWVELEQRLLSRCRAAAGLAKRYDKTGYNAWRDPKKPSQILGSLCREQGLAGPFYRQGQLTVAGNTFGTPPQPGEDVPDSENLALQLLHQWEEIGGFPLVPEHVERRTLYHPDMPGTPMGAVDMWVDVFPKGAPHPNPLPPVDVKPRAAKKYELRVTVWNTKDVILSDFNLVGENSVDQYIKGFLIGPELDAQQTDVHYRSLKGEGMFNWRLVFPFDFLDAEEKIVYKAKEKLTSISKHEEKVPARLTLQVWDADTFSADDFLGTLVLDLSALVRGAKSERSCKAALMDDELRPPPEELLNLFRLRRTRGWWPFTAPDRDGNPSLAGKVDLELQLLSGEEAEKRPCGQGREAPEPLPEPQRPETSFSAFASPLKFLKMSLWDNLKYKILFVFIILLLLIFVAKFVYTIPESVANRIMG